MCTSPQTKWDASASVRGSRALSKQMNGVSERAEASWFSANAKQPNKKKKEKTCRTHEELENIGLDITKMDWLAFSDRAQFTKRPTCTAHLHSSMRREQRGGRQSINSQSTPNQNSSLCPKGRGIERATSPPQTSPLSKEGCGGEKKTRGGGGKQSIPVAAARECSVCGSRCGG